VQVTWIVRGSVQAWVAWWWSEGVAEVVREEKKRCGNWKKEGSTDTWRKCGRSGQNARRVLSLAKGRNQKDCASDLNDPSQQNAIF